MADGASRHSHTGQERRASDTWGQTAGSVCTAQRPERGTDRDRWTGEGQDPVQRRPVSVRGRLSSTGPDHTREAPSQVLKYWTQTILQVPTTALNSAITHFRVGKQDAEAQMAKVPRLELKPGPAPNHHGA